MNRTMSTEQRIKLYDFQTSPNCQRVKIVLEEKKLPYETIPIDLKKKEQKKVDFLKLSPRRLGDSKASQPSIS